MIAVLAVRVLGVAATFGLGVYLARTLGDAGYGTYAFVIGLAGFLAAIGQFGSGMALVRLRLGRDALAPAETRGLYAWHVLISVAGVAVLALIAALIPGRAHDLGPGPMLAVALAVLAGLVVINLFQSVRESALAILPATLLVPLAVIGAAWTLDLATARAVLGAYAVAGGIGFVLFTALFLARFADLPPGRGLAICWRDWGRAGLVFLVAQFGHALLFLLLPAAYGFVADPGQMGQFSAAHRLAAAVLIAFNAVSVYAVPRFADHRVTGDPVALRALMLRVVGVSAALSLPLLAVLVTVPGPLVALVYGADYAQAAALLPVLAAGICLHAASGPIGNFLLMNGAAGFYNRVSVAAGLAGVAALMGLGQAFGPLAAAWALAATLIAWKGLMILRAVALYRQLGAGDAP